MRPRFFAKKPGEVRQYVHYHCTKSKKGYSCSQRRSITQARLEGQIMAMLERVTILPEFRDWAPEILDKDGEKEIKERAKQIEIRQIELDRSQRELDNLVQRRFRELIDDETFMNQRTQLHEKIVIL